MPGLPHDSGDVPQSMVETLELFCDVLEQSYEQFLSTFTHMSTDNVTPGCLEAPEEENQTCFVELKRDGEKTDRKVETKEESEDLHYIEASVDKGRPCEVPEASREGLAPAGFCFMLVGATHAAPVLPVIQSSSALCTY